LRSYFGELVFTTVIPKNVNLEEAHSHYTHVFEHAPKSPGALAYKALVKEVIAR
jgi:chromosome partitioning protein